MAGVGCRTVGTIPWPHTVELQIYPLTFTYYRVREWTSVEISWFFPALQKQSDAKTRFLNLQGRVEHGFSQYAQGAELPFWCLQITLFSLLKSVYAYCTALNTGSAIYTPPHICTHAFFLPDQSIVQVSRYLLAESFESNNIWSQRRPNNSSHLFNIILAKGIFYDFRSIWIFLIRSLTTVFLSLLFCCVHSLLFVL